MQALDSSSPASGPARGRQLAAEERHGGAVALQAAPALTPVPEHALSLERQLPLPPQQRVAARAAPPQGAQLADRLLQRRCRSETALSGLAARQRRPQWLAQLLVAPRQLEGWGLASAASLQQIAARQLCVTLVAQLQQQHGGRVLPLGVVEEVAAELAGRLPEEVAASITQHLRLLTQAPPPTKLSLHQLSTAAAAADSAAEAAAKQLVPIWAVPHLRAAGGGGGGGRPAALLLDWQPSEVRVAENRLHCNVHRMSRAGGHVTACIGTAGLFGSLTVIAGKPSSMPHFARFTIHSLSADCNISTNTPCHPTCRKRTCAAPAVAQADLCCPSTHTSTQPTTCSSTLWSAERGAAAACACEPAAAWIERTPCWRPCTQAGWRCWPGAQARPSPLCCLAARQRTEC